MCVRVYGTRPTSRRGGPTRRRDGRREAGCTDGWPGIRTPATRRISGGESRRGCSPSSSRSRASRATRSPRATPSRLDQLVGVGGGRGGREQVGRVLGCREHGGRARDRGQANRGRDPLLHCARHQYESGHHCLIHTVDPVSGKAPADGAFPFPSRPRMAEDAACELPIFGSRMRSGGWGGHPPRATAGRARPRPPTPGPRTTSARSGPRFEEARRQARFRRRRSPRSARHPRAERAASAQRGASGRPRCRDTRRPPRTPPRPSEDRPHSVRSGRCRRPAPRPGPPPRRPPGRSTLHRRGGRARTLAARLRTVEAEAAGALGHALEDGEDRLPVLTGKSPERN